MSTALDLIRDALRLNRAALVKSPFSLHVGCMSLFGRLVVADVDAFAVHLDPRHESLMIRSDAKKPAPIVGFGTAQILAVDAKRNITKIGECVVGLIAVFMVNLANRPVARHVQKSESMGKVSTTVNADLPSVAWPATACSCSGFASTSSGALYKTRKYAGFMVVVQQFLKALLGKRRIALAHLSFSFNDGLGSDASGLTPRGVALS